MKSTEEILNGVLTEVNELREMLESRMKQESEKQNFTESAKYKSLAQGVLLSQQIVGDAVVKAMQDAAVPRTALGEPIVGTVNSLALNPGDTVLLIVTDPDGNQCHVSVDVQGYMVMIEESRHNTGVLVRRFSTVAFDAAQNTTSLTRSRKKTS